MFSNTYELNLIQSPITEITLILRNKCVRSHVYRPIASGLLIARNVGRGFALDSDSAHSLPRLDLPTSSKHLHTCTIYGLFISYCGINKFHTLRLSAVGPALNTTPDPSGYHTTDVIHFRQLDEFG